MDEPVSVTLREYWAIVMRRKWIVLGTWVLCVLVAGVLCVVLPKSYRSSTLILIENAKIPDEYVKGLVGASVEERLTMLQQQVMSRTLLGQIIEDFKLYQNKVRRDGLESVLGDVRKQIKIDTVGTTGIRGKSVEAFTISFSHEEPMTAMKVTAKLASQYIEENLKVREQMVTGVSVFLEQELNSAKSLLEAKEREISSFKSKYIGLLPEQMEANLRALDRLQSDLHATDELVHSKTDRLGMLEKSIREYEASGTTQALSGSTAPGQPGGTTGMDPLVIRLRELERSLTTLLAEYKETYPDIAQLRQEIAGVKKQLIDKYGDPADEKDADAAKTFDPYLRELIKQRNELMVEVASIKDRRRRLADHIKEFEGRVEQTPAREQELMILLRDYENMQKNYQSLLDKRLNAHVAENLEKRQKGEQFRVLDPANLPEKPEKPNRLVIMLIGLIGGCGLGVGAALGIEQMTPTFKRREEVEMLPGIRVLAAIPNLFGTHHRLNAPGTDTGSTGTLAGRLPALRFGRRRPVGIEHTGGGEPLSPQLSLVTKWQPQSVAAEQYKMAATRLVLSTEERASTVVDITSALKGEGKTTTVVNLGYALAHDLGRKTLLVDCDFRNPGLHRYASVPAHGGLLEYLDGLLSLEECLASIDETPCSILSTGKGLGEVNELTRLRRLKTVLPEMRTKFDYILLNTPPVLPSATMGILADMADLHVLVIRAGVTPKPAVQQAFAMLGLTAEANVILNAVEAQSMPAYFHGYSTAYGGE
ncbi:MAG: AAA family ATPase [Nitrospira sp.]|nr:AAA family ATPase [Nitrospira sp.]